MLIKVLVFTKQPWKILRSSGLRLFKGDKMRVLNMIKLFFQRPIISIDVGEVGGDYTAETYFKKLDGEIYIIQCNVYP